MITIQETQDSVFEEIDAYDRAVMREIFSDEYEKALEEGRKEGRLQGIYGLIFKNYRCRYNADISEKLTAKIDLIRYYPALEEIQYAVWETSSPLEFERAVDSVLEKYAEQIETLDRE